MVSNEILPTYLLLQTDNPRWRDLVPAEGLEIQTFPFSVGRAPGDGEESATDLLDLALPDEPPCHVSRLQFTLMRLDGGFVLVDGSSVNGNVVNGVLMGPPAECETIELNDGTNEILLGGEDSPYRMTLSVRIYTPKAVPNDAEVTAQAA